MGHSVPKGSWGCQVHSPEHRLLSRCAPRCLLTDLVWHHQIVNSSLVPRDSTLTIDLTGRETNSLPREVDFARSSWKRGSEVALWRVPFAECQGEGRKG